MKTQYTLLSGETVEFTAPTGTLGAFVKRVLAAAKDPAVTERELTDLVHGPDNPMLDPSVVPGKTVATAGAELNLNTTSIVTGAVVSITSMTVTMPES